MGCIEKSANVAVLVQDWTKLARALDTPKLAENVLGQQLIWQQKQLLDVIEALLEGWRQRLAGNAKLTKFLDVLETDCGWNDMKG